MTRRRHPLNPMLFGMRASTLFGIYRMRLRNHLVGELLAGAGIAVGVALVFGVLVANSSLYASAGQVLHAVNGSATLQFAARSPTGFSESLAKRATALPGVGDAAMLLRASAVIEGPRGRRPVQLVGVGADLLGLRGAATKDLGAGALLLSGGVGLPSDVASAIGTEAQRPVTLISAGTANRVQVRAVLNSGAIGALSSADVAVALLSRAQELAGLPARVTQVLIAPEAGKEREVVRELRALAAGRIDVLPADNELRLLQTATKPTSQSSDLFAAISVMVGFLLALNAMLLTVPQRRRMIADMRVQGYDSRQVLLTLISQALALGIVASCVGVLLGEVLARTLFHEVPGYLTTAFPISGRQVVRLTTVLAALGCGVLASLLASMSPMFDLRSGQPVDAVLHRPGEPGQNISVKAARRGALLGVAMVALVTALVFAAPGFSIVGGVLLALAALSVIPLAFQRATRVLRAAARKIHGGMLAVTVIELEAAATRSAALAGIAALAIYGLVAVGGARSDLLHGLDQAIVQEWSTDGVWITPNGNSFDADAFRANSVVAAIARAPGIESIRAHQGGFLDVGADRLWIRAAPASNPTIVLSSQLLEGKLADANALLRRGGWVAISSGFAAAHHLRIGGSVTLPTPSGLARLGVAAITTNFGWPSGTLTLSTSDFSRYWQTTDPTTLAVGLKPGVSPAEGKRSVERALGYPRGLRVQTSQQRIDEVAGSTSQGLRSLSEISTLLLLTSALALAAALSTGIYQRRKRLASLKAQGFDRLQLWRSLLLESVVILGIGCLDGAVMGIYGHALADRYLRLGTGFPAPFSVGEIHVVLTLLLIAGISLAVIAIPGYSAAGVSTQASFQE